jgi:hypothetical protein
MRPFALLVWFIVAILLSGCEKAGCASFGPAQYDHDRMCAYDKDGRILACGLPEEIQAACK